MTVTQSTKLDDGSIDRYKFTKIYRNTQSEGSNIYMSAVEGSKSAEIENTAMRLVVSDSGPLREQHKISLLSLPVLYCDVIGQKLFRSIRKCKQR